MQLRPAKAPTWFPRSLRFRGQVSFKARYSAFDHTALDLLLAELECERILLCGAATEGCVVQTGIHAREHGFKVTILARACATTDDALERVALAYAEQVGGIRIAYTD